jgi:hypothetical protein
MGEVLILMTSPVPVPLQPRAAKVAKAEIKDISTNSVIDEVREGPPQLRSLAPD